MGREYETGSGEEEDIKPEATFTLRDLLGWQRWDDYWKAPHSQMLKHILGVLFGNEAVKKFDDEPFRSGRLGKMLQTLKSFGYTLRRLGMLALGRNLEPLKEKVMGLDPTKLSEKGEHKLIAQKAVRKFHNAMSSVVKNVQKIKDWVVERAGGMGKIAAIIDYSPLGFYSLTQDGTCFSGNGHPFLVGMLPNSYTLRIFAHGKGYVGRAWGIIDPKRKVLYVTNRYGDINDPTLVRICSLVASALFNVPPEKLNLKDDAAVEFEKIINRACERIGADTIPYLNGDAFKISTKG